MPRLRILLFAAIAVCIAASPSLAVERSEIAAKYKWDLTALYPTEAAWTSSLEAVRAELPALERFHGRLGVSADSLRLALDLEMDLGRQVERLSTYASMLADQDARVAHAAEMRTSAGQLAVQVRTATAFVRPELLAVGSARIQGFLAAEPRLAVYRPYLQDLLRYERHTLSGGEERIAAQAGRLSRTGATLRNILNNAELPWPTVTLPSGATVRLDDAAYTDYRQSTNRADRDSVFRAFFAAHRAFQNTYGAALEAQVEAHVFDRDIHHYSSCLEAALFRDNIPPAVYQQLIDDVHANLPTLHRYLQLRQRMMGLSELRYEDLYAPIVKEVRLHYTPEEAMDIVLDAVSPLGRAYVDTLGHGYRSGWVDWMPSTGKASGAYSTGAYGVHPFQLQNFTGQYDEVSTLAHESGHSMHTFLADQHQPYVTHDYATFVAEVASTFNENLLFHRMLDHTQDKATRLYLLGSQLDNLRTTLFRQVMFAEFELAIHERAEKGQPLSGETLSKLYLDIVRRYYGHDLGVCKVDSLYGVEWAYIPHFFYDFYVYQYATSIVASTSLANDVRAEAAAGHGTARRDAYLHMLASGSSKYPIDLLREAGVDMTTSAPFQSAMREMNAIMDEMERLLK